MLSSQVVGAWETVMVGDSEGFPEGACVGDSEGLSVGDTVGGSVGQGVSIWSDWPEK